MIYPIHLVLSEMLVQFFAELVEGLAVLAKWLLYNHPGPPIFAAGCL